jgi:hypothetical protein
MRFGLIAETLRTQGLNIFPLAADLPSLKLWQGKDGGKGKEAAPFGPHVPLPSLHLFGGMLELGS